MSIINSGGEIMDKQFFVKEIRTDKTRKYNFGVFSGKVETPDTYICEKNDKPYSRFFYVVNGTIIFDEGTNREVRVPAGHIAYLPNNITYKSHWPAGGTGEYISINFQLDEIYVSLPDRICIAAADKNGYYLNMFKKIYDIWIKGSIGYKLEVLSELYKLLYSLANDSVRSRTKKEHHTIYKGILYLENNYLQDVTVSELAKMCNTSESNFRRLFKKYKKMSPVTYKNYLKIKKSCDLLRSGEYSISEAADAVNIPDICYFYKLFIRFMNVTPKSFIS